MHNDHDEEENDTKNTVILFKAITPALPVICRLQLMEITPCSEREEALVNTLLLVSEVILKLWLILKAKGNYCQCCKKIRGVK